MSELLDLATHCIRCGFCLESCPTYLETGMETESPRGRIYLARSAEEGKLPWSAEAVGKHLDLCVGCRACEPACPSGVEYGRILEQARQRLEAAEPKRARRTLLKGATSPRLLRLSQRLFGGKIPWYLGRKLTNEKPEAVLPRAQRLSSWPEISDSDVPPVKGEVYLLEGCAMRVLYPRVHEATRRLLRRVGFAVRESNAECCGALYAHQGYLGEAGRMARKVERAMDGDLPVIVNSAGCGSFLKDNSSNEFRARVRDVSEFLLENGLAGLLSSSKGLKQRITYHDACHLAHGQRIKEQPRELLRSIPGVEFVELPESDLCCGSGGVYNVLQPKMARRMLERKWKNVESTGARTVVLGNPGCHAWIGQAAREKGSFVRVLHTAEFLEEAFSGEPEH